jgi:hypothetical protein
MIGLNRLASRRALTLAFHPAAWQAMAAEQTWRLRGPCTPAHPADVAHLPTAIYWPTEYEHSNATGFVRPLREGLGKLATVEPREIPQPYPGIVILGVGYQDRRFSIAVDYYDFTFVNEPCLRNVSIYFKMQHRRCGYGDLKILPGGYVAGKRSLYDYYCRLRELRRSTPQLDVYGRFGMGFSAEVRSRAVAILQGDKRFQFVGGTSLALYMQSLREAARARVCIDMPGNGPFCYRLVEYLAAGCCVVAPRHEAVMHGELRDREHIVYCRPDLADLADLCAYYVENGDARREIETNAARFFDDYLYPTRLASYYLQALDDRLSSWCDG